MAMTIVLVAVGAAVGAPLRYLTDRYVQARLGTAFPWGTLIVNIVGSFVFGWVLAAWDGGRLDDAVMNLVGVGFCGALTTYSTFGYETLRLIEGGRRWSGLVNVVVSVVAGLVAAAAGWALGP